MPDLQPDGRPKSPAEKEAETLLPLPSAPVTIEGDVEFADLTAEDLQARIDARQRDIKFRIGALKHEVMTVAEDVNVGGRPLIDRVRERPLAAVGLALASGAMVGLLWGLRSRAKRRPAPDEPGDIIRYHVATMLDAAAMRVARGATADDALAAEMRKRPVVFVPNDDETRIKPPLTARKQATDTALKTLTGIAVKTGMDLLTKRFTPHEEVFEALADESATEA